MRKYLAIIRNTCSEILTYRLNFAIWRLRTVLQLLISYFLWSSVFPEKGELFGYTRDQMLTYILGSQIVYAFVMTTRTQEIAENISKGELSAFLIRPLGYFQYWFFRDLGDKAMNIIFSLFELLIIFFLLHPLVFLQTNPILLFLTLVTVFSAIILNFLLSCLLSMTGFWSSEVWAPRYIFYTLLIFFAGGIFPLDIFPKPVFETLMLFPFAYMQYFPIKIYLGQLKADDIMQGFLMTILWILVLYLLLRFIWNKGLKVYTAVGDK